MELSGEVEPMPSLRLGAQVDWLERKNVSSPAIATTNTPKRRYRAVANWEFATNWRLRVDGQYESERISNTTGTRIAGAYAVVNAFARYGTDHWGVEFGGKNLGDRLYAFEEGFFEAGRTWVAQLDVKF